MPDSPPFVDPATGELDTDQLRVEAVRLGRLAALFALLGVVPLALVSAMPGSSATGVLFSAVWLFFLVLGGGVLLMYVVARGIQLADV